MPFWEIRAFCCWGLRTRLPVSAKPRPEVALVSNSYLT